MNNHLPSPAGRPDHARLRPPRQSLKRVLKRTLAVALCGVLALANAAACAEPASDNQPAEASPATPQQTPGQLQQLVAPIALYPDPLVAQILAASTYPAEVVEADRWFQQHSALKGKQLASEVDKQSWDPSVKALTEFPSVLANMDKNLSWTSSLGEAYVNQPQDVMNAVQEMRHLAQNAGHLKSTPQENVTTQGQTVEIQPASPQVVYVPQYDPWAVYGPPVAAWPGWYPYPGLYVGTPGIAFGIGIGVGLFAGFAWGMGHWGFDWAHRSVVFNHSRYVSHSTTFINRRTAINRRPVTSYVSPVNHRAPVDHTAFNRGTHSSAFSGFDHGGVARSYASRGRSSVVRSFHGGGRR